MARGSVNHPLLPLWLSGWRRAGCTQARGHHVPLFVLHLCSFLPVPTFAETNLASVTAIPARKPSACRCQQVSPLLSYLFILYSTISLLFYQQQWKEQLSGPQAWVCLCCFQMQNFASRKANSTKKKAFASLECLRERQGGGGVLLPRACDSDKDVRDPAAEMTFVLPSRG